MFVIGSALLACVWVFLHMAEAAPELPRHD